MTATIYYICFLLSLVFLFTIIRFIRKRKLKEQYGFLWLGLSVVMMFLSVFPEALIWIAGLIHVSYAPSVLYVLAILGILFILLHMTLTVSILTERSIILAQKVAIQQEQIQRLLAQSQQDEQS
jgi:hypothetical protein